MEMAVDTWMEALPSQPATLDHVAAGLGGGKRHSLAARLGTAFVEGRLSRQESMVAITIFKCLADDTEVEVRRMLAEHIKASPLLPHSIARRLAQDIEEVAAPILRSSTVLQDEDLLAIIESGNTVKQCAIAGRESISEEVSAALIETRKKAVVEALLVNEGAEISEAAYHRLIDAFAQDGDIQTQLVERSVLPFEIRQRLVCLVSEDLQTRMIEEHAIPPLLARELTHHGREKALVGPLNSLATTEEIETATTRLHRHGALTPTLMLRLLCAGQVPLFAAALAALAKVPVPEVQQALATDGAAALRAFYGQTGLPHHLQKAFHIALEEVLTTRHPEMMGPLLKDVETALLERLVLSYRRLSPDGLESVIFQLGRLNGND